MKTNSNILFRMFGRKLALIILLGASMGAFASLGDGKKPGDGRTPGKSLLSLKKNLPAGSFSLKSGFIYRDFKVIATEKENFINLNTVITYQKGNSTYILPLKKKVLLDKIIFNPDEKSRKF